MIQANIKHILDRIGAAVKKTGRNPGEIKLVVVSKTVEVEKIREAIRAGVTILGENRVQEAEQKIPLVPEQVSWHLIGHLQRNKVKKALSLFHYIHSVDSVRLVREISRHAVIMQITIPILLQINVSGELSKFGVSPEDGWTLLETANKLPGLNVRGLMTIPPFFPDPERSRPYYIKLRELFQKYRSETVDQDRFNELSMGMSNDFEIAVEEGATFVRIGTAIFGERT